MNYFIKKTIFLFLILSHLPLFCQNLRNENKIAFINLAEILDFLEEAVNYNNVIEKKRNKILAQVDRKSKKLKYKKNLLENQRNNSEEKQILLEEIFFLEEELVVFIEKQQEELEVFQKKLDRTILKNLYTQIKNYAKKNKIELILDVNQFTLFENYSMVDITNEILSIVEKDQKRIKFN